MSTRPSGPSIPERTSARTSVRTSTSSNKERKRQSLQSSPPKEAGRRSSNHVTVKPASTEVISSLIETLSAISTPVEHHFDNLPDINASDSVPASPDVRRSDGSGAYATLNGHRANRLLHPDHASIRGLSRLEASSNNSLRATYRKHAKKGSEDDYSIGQVSVEAQPWQSSVSVGSVRSDRGKSLRSARSLTSLRFKDSKESFQAPRLSRHSREAVNTVTTRKDRLFLTESRSPTPSIYEIEVLKRGDHKKERDESPSEIRVSPLRNQDTTMSPKRLFLNTADDSSIDQSSSRRSSYALSNPDSIPKRNSSIRHSRTLSSSERKRRSRSQYPEGDQPELGRREFSILPDRPVTTAEGLENQEESGVTRRIRELQDQKEQRKRLSLGDGPDLVSTPEKVEPSTPPGPTMSTDVRPSSASKHLPKLSTTGLGVHAEQPHIAEEQFSAPPPTVRTTPFRLRQDATRRSLSMGGGRPSMTRHTPTSSREEGRSASFALPQRRNSSLLKRLSQQGSPTSGEKQMRRLSNPIPPLTRTESAYTSGGDSVDDAVERYMSAPRLSQKAVNPLTGRVISFSEVGDPNGSVVFCCVGMGLTRYVTAFYDELAATLKLRLITPDRPGIGGSEPHADGHDTPLGWPDDVRYICEHLGIVKFSLLAHSAGAIYALATALRMPQHIRCRVHLLAPWIPPSQLSSIGTQQDPVPTGTLPYSQRVLRSLPTPFLKAANASFFSITSNSITTSLPKSPKRTKRRPLNRSATPAAESPIAATTDGQMMDDANLNGMEKENRPPLSRRGSSPLDKLATNSQHDLKSPLSMEEAIMSDTNGIGRKTEKERAPDYNKRLTTAIWDAATTNANAATDLIVCLERRQPIGFRYVDITRAVVIHHGSKDTRVPVENVKWLGAAMRRCEVRVLDGEGHGLMASAAVMGGVLMEMSREWEDWLRVVRGKRGISS